MVDGNVFVDTNVLLYSFDSRQPRKREQASEWLSVLWQTGSGRLSWQVLHEFYANAIRKTGTPAREARKALTLFTQWQPAAVTLGLIDRAWYWMDEAQLSYWDSLILASAERYGCPWLLSEAFQAGRKYESLIVVNPFEQAP